MAEVNIKRASLLKGFHFAFCRSRSRSPSEARSKLPTELVKHFEFGLVEPGDPNNPQEIPYTNVETQKPIKVRYGSNGRRSRHSSGNSARRKM